MCIACPLFQQAPMLPFSSAKPFNSMQLRAAPTLLVYQWMPSANLNYSNILNPVFSGETTTTLTFRASDAFGCSDSSNVTVTVEIPNAVVLPNVITPDGDGKNDVWKIDPNIDLSGSHLIIFNRWGDRFMKLKTMRTIGVVALQKYRQAITGWHLLLCFESALSK